MALVNKRITTEELAERLVGSKKIMHKVNTGDYEKGNIDESLLVDGPSEIAPNPVSPAPPTAVRKSLGLPVGVPSVEKIRGSKLPDVIKTAMIENPIPIPNISLTDSLDMNFVNNAKRLMESDNALISMGKGGTKQSSRQVQTESYQPQSQFDVNSLIPLIENAVRKVFNEKLIQILDAQNSVTINENLVIKVGDSLFSGKITKVKNSK